ncbi:MAG: serine protease [bacterium]|nr:serine protease [bacterium]
MEELNKQQLILLALLVSFVTSIATGIVTVSLMDQAPPVVTQTINRVVEKTIERVITEPSVTTPASAVIARETIVVKADDQVIEAIAKNIGSIVRIKEVTGDPENRRTNFAAIGLVVSSDGLIAADLGVARIRTDDLGNPVPESYIGVFPDGRIFPLNIVSNDQRVGFIFFAPLLQAKEKGVYKFVLPSFSSAPLQLGQAVVAIGGEDTNAVSTGIISNLVEKQIPQSDPAKPSEKMLTAIKTDIRGAELVSGSLLLNLSGEVIGMNAGVAAPVRTTFVPVKAVLDLAAALPPTGL